jgi:hypothetical protein
VLNLYLLNALEGVSMDPFSKNQIELTYEYAKVCLENLLHCHRLNHCLPDIPTTDAISALLENAVHCCDYILEAIEQQRTQLEP